jgi:hypothetical protein
MHSIKFICTNPDCSYTEFGPFEIELRTESYMDENNIATLFCPHCKSALSRGDCLECSAA